MSEILGIDVSHYQHKIDWKKVKAQGKQFAILKCMYEAQSHRIDETFEYNYKECGNNGIARGVYIFVASASIADTKGDAQALLNHLKGRPLEYGIWLDYEAAVLRKQGKEKIKEMTKIYADMFRKAGYFVGIYCNVDWYNNVIHDDLKKKYDFWIARYPKTDKGNYNPSSKLKPTFKGAVAWQYSSKGNVDGITGNVDLNVDYDGVINLITKKEEKKSNPYKLTAKVLRKGSKGESVKWVQWVLNECGYGLVEDGSYDSKTLAAVKDFQSKHGLLVDGICGNKTLTAMSAI